MTRQKNQLNVKNAMKLIACLMIFIQVFAVGTFGNSAYASSITEFLRNEHIAEDNYDYEMSNVAEPYIDSIKKTGYINGVDRKSVV